VIAIDTSVLVRYVVGSPPDQTRAASTLIEASEEIGISPVALVECAHVLRTQYAVPQSAVIDALIAASWVGAPTSSSGCWFAPARSPAGRSPTP
jgi:predicted nucleic acid-binding protein